LFSWIASLFTKTVKVVAQYVNRRFDWLKEFGKKENSFCTNMDFDTLNMREGQFSVVAVKNSFKPGA